MDRKFGTNNLLPDISDFDHSNTTIGTIQLLWNKVVQMKLVHYALFGTIFIALILCIFILCACCFIYHPIQLARICCCACWTIRLQERGRTNARERGRREAQQTESGLELLARDARNIHQSDRQTRPGPVPEQQAVYIQIKEHCF